MHEHGLMQLTISYLPRQEAVLDLEELFAMLQSMHIRIRLAFKERKYMAHLAQSIIFIIF